MRIKPFIILSAILSICSGVLSASGQTPPRLYNEPVSKSNPLRTEQARELEGYIATLRKDTSRLALLLKPDYSSPKAFDRSTEAYRKAFAASIGYPPPGQPAATEKPRFELLATDDIATYHRVHIPVLPGVNAEGIYAVPLKAKGKLPLIISMHGGGGSPEVALFNGGGNYHNMVRGALTEGYAVFAPQHLFQADGYPGDVRNRIDARLRLLGTSITAIEVWKISKSLDTLTKRPEIDGKRIGMVGLSYGGFYALMAPAFDKRIKVTASSCYYGVQEWRYLKSELGLPSDFIHMDRISLFQDSDIAALICPRALHLQAGKDDDDDHRDGGILLAPKSKSYYTKLGIEDKFEFTVFDGGHEWRDDIAWAFIRKHL